MEGDGGEGGEFPRSESWLSWLVSVLGGILETEWLFEHLEYHISGICIS